MNIWKGFPLFPERASSAAGEVDAFFFFLVGISAFFAILIFILITVFMIKYKRRPGVKWVPNQKTPIWLEVIWTAIPLALTMVMFYWGARLFFHIYRSPPGAIEILVVGKQWMWKLQHPEGKREINELHIPAGKPIRLKMISEDVIHDFFVPAFRIKRDVLPGRYTSVWFTATKPGSYRFFCAQYCGTEHSLMRGWVQVLTPPDYQKWLSGGTISESPVEAGSRLFQKLGCANCHHEDNTGRGPALLGVYGKIVKLQDGQTQMADDNYLRQMILTPGEKIVAGYQPIMPAFKGIINEENLLQLIAYLKSLAGQQRTEQATQSQ